MRHSPVVVLVLSAASAVVGCASPAGTDTLSTHSGRTTPATPTPVPADTTSQSPAPGVTATVSATSGTASAPAGHLVTPTASSSSPTPRPTRSGPVTLTENDSGETVSVRVGDQISVVLGGNGQQWHQPAAQDGAVRRTAASGGYPTTQPARATFVAVTDGTTRLTSTTDAPCLHGNPRCMIAQRVWSVDVVVHG